MTVDKQEETLIRIDQNVINITERVERIENHVKVTNGKVADAHIEIEKLKLNNSNCPARLHFDKEKDKVDQRFTSWKASASEWVKFAILLLIAIGPHLHF